MKVDKGSGSNPPPAQWSRCYQHQLDGQTLRMFEWARPSLPAPALAMVHGLEEGWDVWLDLCLRLSDRFNLFSLDLPWSGRRGYRWGHRRSPADWLHQILQAMPIPPEALVAHSFGANTVLEYLQQYEAHGLRAVVLVSPFYCPRYEDLDWALYERVAHNFRRVMEHGLRVRKGGRPVDPSMLSDMTEKVLDRVGPLGYLEFFSLYVRTPALELERLRLPVQIVSGEQDYASTPAGNAALARSLPNAQLEQIPACGHYCMLERPDRLAEAVRRFLTEQLVASEVYGYRGLRVSAGR